MKKKETADILIRGDARLDRSKVGARVRHASAYILTEATSAFIRRRGTWCGVIHLLYAKRTRLFASARYASFN